MPRHSKILDILEPADLAAYETFCDGRPVPTMDARVEWLGDHGYTVSRKAAWTHSRNLEQQLARIKESSAFARGIMETARKGGIADIADANLLQLQLKLSEQLFRDEEVEPGELMKIAIALRSGVATKKELEEFKEKAAAALKALETKVEKKGVLTNADIAEARKAVFG